MDADVEGAYRTIVGEYDPRHEGGRTTHLGAYRRPWSPEGDLAERYHENTKYREGRMGTQASSIREFSSSPGLRHALSRTEPDYAASDLLELPHAEPEGSLASAIGSRRSVRSYADAAVNREALGALLGFGCGVTGEIDTDGGGRPVRAYPSAGALYPIEPYVAVVRGRDPVPGLYYYVPERHALRVRERDDGIGDALAARFTTADGGVDIGEAAAVVVLAGAFGRAKAKYGPRGYRYAVQEAGHAAQNIGLVAASLGLGSVVVAGFYDDALSALLGIDGRDEAPVTAVAVGAPEGSG